MAAENVSRSRYAWLVMIGCFFLQTACLGGVMNSAGIFWVPVCTELGIDRGALGLYLTFYFVTTTFAYPLVAKFVPRWNFRVFLSTCVAIICLTQAAMGFFTAVWMWYIAGVVLGLAGALTFVVASTVLIENWFEEKRGIALGISMCGSGIGGMIFPILGQYFIATMGWRMSYILTAIIIAVMALPFTIFVLHLHPEDIGLKPYGAGSASTQGDDDSIAHGMPVKKAVVTLAFICIFFYGGIEALFSGYNNHLPGFMESLGYDAAFGATILALAQFGYMVATLVMGWVTDKFGVAVSTYLTLALTAASLAMFCLFHDSVSLMLAAFIFGMNSVVITISVPTLVSEIFGKKHFAEMLSYTRMSGIIGSVGAAAIGACYDMTGSFIPAFGAGIVILAICALLVALALGQRKKIRAQWE